MLKKLILVTAISMTVIATQAHATGFPQTDVVKIATQVWESFQRYSEHLIDKVMSETKLDTQASNAEMEIEAWNNGAANAVARINQAYADVFNMEQTERSVSAPGTCDTLMYRESMDDSLCNTASAIEDINASHKAVYQSSTQAVAGQSLNSLALAAASGDRFKNTRDAYERYQTELGKHIENLERHVAAGRGADVYRADLMDINDASPFAFTDDQLDIAKSRYFIEHPIYLEALRDNELDDKHIAKIEQKRILWDTATQVTAKNIALKTPGDNNFPSRLQALQMAAKIRLVEGLPDASDTDGKSFLQDIALKNNGEGATAREKMIMASFKLDQAFTRYKQTLELERQISNYALIKYHDVKE